MDNANEVCFQVSSTRICKWFYREDHAKKWFLWEKERNPVCIKIFLTEDGQEKERTPHHFD
jgi:hypothetical protein